MDTPTIAAYYREADPMKRKNLLEQSIEAGEEPEENAIRKELWELRYQGPSELGPQTRADGFLGLWMILEFNRDAGKRLFGGKGARKEIVKSLEKLKFRETCEKSSLHEELLYRECCHMVKLYMDLCEKDKSYNSVLCGILTISKDRAKNKLKNDIYETAISLPPAVGMENELSLITKAAKEMYELHFPGEGGLEDL
ncbi:MAG TPA: hypothetical protein IAA21_07080 [Candidatus Blautia faecigallinarum]|uniref:Uncharacterized protein n=1 Tax=Candidatus Blautia faecigallinarum TaxID=2838488 RepID=A0A9D2IT57_9FIRM|nr:hypothetical protein [Candidatus Blautia faecigallinarum]